MPEQSTTLRDMILEARDGGETYRGLAARAIDPVTGETASYGLINNIVLGKNRAMPEAAHLRAIAAALRVPYEQVLQAALAQWYPAEERAQNDHETTAQLVADAERLRAQYEAAVAKLDDAASGRRPRSA